ncbi:hypothetical protein [Streptomyces chrestomyceticus]|uniref:hypothetical protein n=1 Tax=Streptomyces chrestomyceticus TaxID=68185 RepID=UPI0033E446D1
MSSAAPVPAGAPAPGAAPRYLVRPAENADQAHVRRLVAEHLPWTFRCPLPGDPADNLLMRQLGALDTEGLPVTWVLLEGSHLRGCALVSLNAARDLLFRARPGSDSGLALWIDLLYADLDGPEPPAYGPLLTAWFIDYADRHDQVSYVCAWLPDGPVADDLRARDGMEILRSAPTESSLLRLSCQRLPYLDELIEAQLPPCVRGRRPS